MEVTMLSGPEQIGTHQTLAHGQSLASSGQLPSHPNIPVWISWASHLYKSHPLAQSPSAMQASGTGPCWR